MFKNNNWVRPYGEIRKETSLEEQGGNFNENQNEGIKIVFSSKEWV